MALKGQKNARRFPSEPLKSQRQPSYLSFCVKVRGTLAHSRRPSPSASPSTPARTMRARLHTLRTRAHTSKTPVR
eukprot:5689017-Pleurochrysis_carterae.AAC.1